MPGGLAALLDDIAAIAKLSAASIDDIGAAATRAGVKAAGVVVDDAAVTPRYVTGFPPQRELPIIWRIAKGSLINKIVFILPALLLLSWLLPWLLQPILMAGGAFLCFEGVEKVIHSFTHKEESLAETAETLNSEDHEKKMVSGAITTDFILSAEIMMIALNEVAEQALVMRAVSLVVVAIAITAIVYGAVGLIVKMDDFGLKLASGGSRGRQAFGRGLVKAMPVVMSVLSVVGIAAMIWVGGGIIIHGLHAFHVDGPEQVAHHVGEAFAHAIPALGGLLAWIGEALVAGVAGLVVGALIVAALRPFVKH